LIFDIHAALASSSDARDRDRERDPPVAGATAAISLRPRAAAGALVGAGDVERLRATALYPVSCFAIQAALAASSGMLGADIVGTAGTAAGALY
jgi:hypothetical protein